MYIIQIQSVKVIFNEALSPLPRFTEHMASVILQLEQIRERRLRRS